MFGFTAIARASVWVITGFLRCQLYWAHSWLREVPDPKTSKPQWWSLTLTWCWGFKLTRLYSRPFFVCSNLQVLASAHSYFTDDLLIKSRLSCLITYKSSLITFKSPDHPPTPPSYSTPVDTFLNTILYFLKPYGPFILMCSKILEFLVHFYKTTHRN